MLVPAVLTGLGCLALLFFERQGQAVGRLVAKPLAAAGFVWGGCLNLMEAPSALSTGILVGLCLSALGDLLLLSRDRRFFLAGLTAFLLAHVAYAGTFLATMDSVGSLIGGVVVASAGCAWVARGIWDRLDDGMRPAVLAYMAAIALMVGAAWGTAPATWWFGGGALLFVVSDIAVARDRFIQRSFSNKVWGLPLYFSAQWMFVIGTLHWGA